MKLRVGLVGLGESWESRHLPALRALNDRFEIRGVCSEISLRAERAAKEFNADAVDGFRALMSREDIDAVLVLSPEWYGPVPILAACEAEKAVYCASALDFDSEQARLIRERVDRSGIAFMAEFPRRHAPATLRLKELIATRLGRPKLLCCHRRRPGKNNGNRQLNYDPLKRELQELVDWCRYVVGRDPTSVMGMSHPDDCYYRMMNLEFSSENSKFVTAQISCGNYVPSGWNEAITFRTPSALQVSCEKGIAFVDLPSSIVWFDEAGRHVESLESERPVGEQLLSIFHRAVTSLVRRLDNLEDAYRALEIVSKAEQSQKSGQRIEL